MKLGTSPIKYVYDGLIRTRLPKRFGVYNGISVRNVALFDFTDEWPDHEEPNVQAHQEHTRRGDDVVLLGGGYAVSAAYAGRAVGKDGSVTVFEPAKESYELCCSTLNRQRLQCRIDIEQASVGPINNPYGSVTQADQVDPSQIPECDVLEIDIEGGELEVLDELLIRPRHIYLETHGTAGVSKEEGHKKLESMGYEVINTEVEFEEKGIYVIIAKLKERV